MNLPLLDPVRTVMQSLASGLRSILGARLIGLYLGGSFSLGDFWEATSDLDFLAVTDGPLSPEDLLAIGLLHRELLQTHRLASRLEGDYAPRQTLIAEGTTVPVPGCERGIFLPRVGEVMLSADNIYNLREQGIAFAGPPPCQALPAVSREQVRAAVRTMLAEGHGTCESPHEAADNLLSLCRSLCALETGEPTTKSQGADWARSRLEEHWVPVIEAAAAARRRGITEHWDEQLWLSVRELDLLLRERYLADPACRLP